MFSGFAVPNTLLPMREWSQGSNKAGGKVRYGKTREDVNRYLKWAYSEAANVIARYHPKYAFRHVGQLMPESERERATRKQ